MSPETAFELKVATLRASRVLNATGIAHVGSRTTGGIWGDLSITPTPKTVLLPEFPSREIESTPKSLLRSFENTQVYRKSSPLVPQRSWECVN